MAQLRHDYSEFKKRGAEVLSIGPESAAAYQRYWKMNNISFIGLPDSNKQVSNLYAQEVNWAKLGRMPAIFIIDRKGIVRFAYYGNSMSDIPSNTQILEILDALTQEENV